MKKPLFLLLAFSMSLAGCSQTDSDHKNTTPIRFGGGCEGCEAVFESPVPFDQLKSKTTLADFHEAGPKLEVSGIVYQRDGKTAAPDVVIYFYHTDQSGRYRVSGNEKGWAKRHGTLRGWVKTDKNGFYQFYTLRPAAYPGRQDPAHIHAVIKEPGKNEYWIDDFLFDDDLLLTAAQRKNQQNRGGNGILELVPQENGIAHGTRHIILGLNVPGYPYAGLPKLKSGLEPGSAVPDFHPLHLTGPDSGRYTSPFQSGKTGPGLMVWFNHANLDQMNTIVKKLEKEIEKRGEENLKVLLVYMNPFYQEADEPEEKKIVGRKLKIWYAKQGLKNVILAWIPSPIDKSSAGVYQINSEAKNTLFVYHQNKIKAKWVNEEYNDELFNSVYKILNEL